MAFSLDGGRLSASLGSTFASLEVRNFRLFFIGQTISNTGNWLTNIALTLLILKLTDSGTAVGLLAACQYGPVLLITPWAGALIDRHDKRRGLFITQSIEMVQSAGLATLAFMHRPPTPALFALALIGGTALAFDNPLRRSFVSEMVPTHLVPNAVVLYSTIVNTARIVGPALAGILVTTVGYGWAFVVDVSSYAAVLICLFLMRPSELLTRAKNRPLNGTVREGLQYIASLPKLWIPLLMLCAIGTLAYNFTVSFPLLVTKAFHGSDSQYATFYSVFSAGAIVCTLAIASRARVGLSQIIHGALALGACLLLLGISPGLLTASVAVFFVGVASILYTTATTTNFQLESRQELHGRVLALQSAVLVGSSALGGPLLGSLSGVFGARSIVLFGGCVCLLAGAAGLLASRRHQLL